MTASPENPARRPFRLDPQSALRSWGAHLLIWLTTLLALFADLWTKDWAFRALGPDDIKSGPGGWLTFQRSLNDGALFGMGTGLVPLFILASILAVGFIVYLFACSLSRQRFLHVALGFILAGALGNLFDRTFMQADRIVLKAEGDGSERRFLARIVEDRGEELRVGSWPDGGRPRSYRRDELFEPPRSIGVVRDFIKIAPIGGREIWPWIFNVADALLVAGVGMLLLGLAFERRTAGTPMTRDSAEVPAT